MSSVSPALDLGSAVQSFGRLLWLSHGLVVIAVVASLQLFSGFGLATGAATSPDLSRRVASFDPPTDIAAPSANVKPMAFVVCSLAEAKQARAEIPRWTWGRIAVRGITEPAAMDELIAQGVRGDFDLVVYDCD